MNGRFTVVGLIDTGSSGCLLRASAAARCGLEIVPEATALCGFGNITVPAAKSIGGCKADIRIDGVLARYMLPFRHPVVPEQYLILDDLRFFNKVHKGFSPEEEYAHKYMFSQSGTPTSSSRVTEPLFK
ncbi:hypothetical protein MTO96_033201 [Rhipicephalus appendiculatus]